MICGLYNTLFDDKKSPSDHMLLDQDEFSELAPASSVQSNDDDNDQDASCPNPWALTCSAFGLQMYWSTINANLPMYFASLDLSRPIISLVLICQPISGCIVGPLVGVMSDRIRCRWGRRRITALSGLVLHIMALLALAWVEEITAGLKYLASRHAAQLASITCSLCLSLSVQLIQNGTRSIMVEHAPAPYQTRISALAARQASIGGMLGYLASSVSLPEYLPETYRVSQFQALALLCCFVLVTSVTISCGWICEASTSNVEPPFWVEPSNPLRQLYKRIQETGPCIRRVLFLAFCAWFGWFSFLYGTSTYIAELKGTRNDPNTRDHGAKPGSTAGFWFAACAVLVSFILPRLLVYLTKRVGDLPGAQTDLKLLQRLLTTSLFLQGLDMLASLFVSTPCAATVQIALAGLPWAVSQWVPFAIVGYELRREQGEGNPDREDLPRASEVGSVLGVYNLFVSLPQIIAGCLNGFIDHTSGDTSVPTAWTFVPGGIAAVVAALAFEMSNL